MARARANLVPGGWLNVTSPAPQNAGNLWPERVVPPASNAGVMYLRLVN
jgi:hypothetical protein